MSTARIKPCIVVAGMGRCGTSLMMQMLAATGVPCVGTWPDFETDASAMGQFDPRNFSARSGEAIKLIDPANLPIRGMPNHIVIWLDRSPREQAKSQVKLLAGIGMFVPNKRAATRAFQTKLCKSRDRHRAKVGVPGGCPALTIRFEDLIETPNATSGEIQLFLHSHGWTEINAATLAAQVKRRDARCYPGFLEAQLLSERATA